MLPKRTKFMGINYVIESHILERGKLKYRSSESFMLTNIDSTAEETSSAYASPEPSSAYEITSRTRP
jgi:hypothetical protein